MSATGVQSTRSSSPSSTSDSTAPTSPSASPKLSDKDPEGKYKISLPLPFAPPSLVDPARDGPPLPLSLPPLPTNQSPTEVAELDIPTPDGWVKRNPNLIRLTGRHPFNTEARLAALLDAGFLTPAHLHFVRNHGAVPDVPPAHLITHPWTIKIHGLVEREVEFTLRDLSEMFPVVTLPVTLVCAGNRRKEQNIVRKSLGFSWGAAGVSTALWTGVYLSDVLAYLKPIKGKAKHVVFEGGDSLPNGPYGTSQQLSWAANKDRGMLIAWAMNGLPLEPDHGFPVRMIIPGQIGGRSVKWLRRIEISDKESQHYLHFWDNKVLPTQVLPDQARAEKHWWYDPRYIIKELNVNSAIAKPDHDELLDLHPDLDTTHNNSASVSATYTAKGYAYSGGGRRVTRVEVSLDMGETWLLAHIDYPEDLYRLVCHDDPVYGRLDLTERDTSFCWCFWSFDIPHATLAQCDALMVRAMDEGLALQPRDMYWSALGMMNNWWFRVAIHKTVVGGKTQLRFEHPTLAGTAAGGWMERMKTAGKDILKPTFGSSSPSTLTTSSSSPPADTPITKPDVHRKITVSELRNQPKEKPWFVVNGEVYDGTPFLNEHPGGGDSILLVAGEDASEDFMAIHSPEGRAKLAEYHIGTLASTMDKPSEGQPTSTNTNVDAAFLEKKIWKSVILSEIRQINHDSYVYRFALPDEQQSLGLPVGQHVFVRMRRKDTKELVQRAYTPVSKEDATGFIDFLIKLYLPTLQFPAGGKMTSGFHQLVIGDTVELKGPLGSFIWKGAGKASWKGVERNVKEIGMVCGGSGITPIIQVLRSILHDENDQTTRISLVSANKTESDILCREELDALHALHGHGRGRFKLHYTLGKVPPQWEYSAGRLNDAMMLEHMPVPSEDGLILVCGPEPMINQAIKPGLQRMGWDIERSLVVF